VTRVFHLADDTRMIISKGNVSYNEIPDVFGFKYVDIAEG
jgi:hypothetical protein